MNFLVAFLAILGCSLAHPQGGGKPHVVIVKQWSDLLPDGSYTWGYNADNGINAQEQGKFVASANSKDGGSNSVQGSVEFKHPDGSPGGMQYTADENGFNAAGPWIPTPPPIPDYILRSIEYNLAHPEPESKAQGRF